MNIRSAVRRAPAPGFTLLELLIAVVIVGILAAVAIPSYTQYIKRAHRNNATAILMETGQYLERFYSINETYAGVAVTSAVSPKGAAGNAVRYNISFSTPSTAKVWALKAVPANQQVGEACGTLTLDSTGAQGPTPKTCW